VMLSPILGISTSTCDMISVVYRTVKVRRDLQGPPGRVEFQCRELRPRMKRRAGTGAERKQEYVERSDGKKRKNQSQRLRSSSAADILRRAILKQHSMDAKVGC